MGVSFDSVEDNRRFAEAQGFPFALVSDVDRSVGERYGTVGSPGERGPEQARRITYLISPAGAIVRSYRVRDVAGHPAQVLEDLRALAEADA